MSTNFLPAGAKSDAVLPVAPPEQRDPQAVAREDAGRAADHILRGGNGQVVVLSNGGVGTHPRGSVVRYDQLIVVAPPPPGSNLPPFDYKAQLVRLLSNAAIRPAADSEVRAADEAASASPEGARVIKLPEAEAAAVVSQTALLDAQVETNRMRQMLIEARVNPDTGAPLSDAEYNALRYGGATTADSGGTTPLPDTK